MVNLSDLLQQPRRSASSLSELAPWFGILPPGNLVLCNDGSLLAGFEFEGMSFDGVEDEVLNGQIDLLQRSLRGMSDRVTLWSVLERRFMTEYEVANYISPVARRIDEAWGEKVCRTPHARLTHLVFIGFRMGAKTDAFFEGVKHELEQPGGNIIKALYRTIKRQVSTVGTVASVRGHLMEMAAEFEKLLSSFESITGPQLGFQRLEGESFLGALYSRLNLASPPGPLRVPEGLSYLAQAIAADTLVRQNDLFEFRGPARKRFVAGLSTVGMPAVNSSHHIDQLLKQNCEFAVCQMFQFLDTEVAQTTIQKAEMHYRMEVKSLPTRVAEKLLGKELDKVNTGNLRLAEDAQEALADLTSTDIAYGYYAMTILAYGDTAIEANHAADQISAAFRANSYSVTREVNGLMPAFLTTLPGNTKTALRKYLASSANVADLIPLRGVRFGDPYHEFFSGVLGRHVPSMIQFMTAFGVPYHFNTHQMDLGHAAIIGGSGAGKTTLMHLAVSMFQKYYPANTFMFDKDYSMMLITKLLGGQHIDIATREGKRVGMNPVRRMLQNGDELPLRRWLEVLITAGSPDQPLSGQENEELYAAIAKVKTLGEAHWRLGSIYTQIKGANKGLAIRLAPYVDRSDDEFDISQRGAFSDFFDNEEDAFELSSIVGVETGKLLELPQVASPFMDYAFYCIEQKLDGRTPTMIYVEEAWYMLSNPVFAAKMDDWLRTFRKKKAFLVFATQALDEISKMQSVGAFIANVPTRIFLPSINSSVMANAHLYEAIFSFNEKQLDLLNKAIPKRDYMIVKANETTLVSADMPKIIIKINDATSREDMRDKATAMSRGGSDYWAEEFIQEVLHA
jgi:type IV secretion system protein TrbE